jgi:hypothetical protein
VQAKPASRFAKNGRSGEIPEPTVKVWMGEGKQPLFAANAPCFMGVFCAQAAAVFFA